MQKGGTFQYFDNMLEKLQILLWCLFQEKVLTKKMEY